MSKEDDNKALVGRWFTHFWGKTCDLAIVDELAAPDMRPAIFAARADVRHAQANPKGQPMPMSLN
jgi:hypothetical protein